MGLLGRFTHTSQACRASGGLHTRHRRAAPAPDADREEPGKPRKDARRGRCHPLEAGFWPLWMTPLPGNCSHKSQVTSLCNRAEPKAPQAPPWVGSRSPDGWDQIPYRPGGWVLHQPPWSFGFDSQTRGTRENRRTLCRGVAASAGEYMEV